MQGFKMQVCYLVFCRKDHPKLLRLGCFFCFLEEGFNRNAICVAIFKFILLNPTLVL